MKKFFTLLMISLFVVQLFGQVTAEKSVVTRGHEVFCIAYSQDGEMVATGGSDRTVRVFKTKTWEEIARLKGLKDIPLGLAFSSNGKFIAAGGKDKKVTVWNVSSHYVTQTLAGHKKWVRDVAFSPDDKFIATAGYDGVVMYWNAQSGSLLKTFVGHKKEVTTLDFSPNGDKIVSGSADNTIAIWDVKSGSMIKSIVAHDGWVRSVVYSPDGSLIASGGDDRRIQVWDAISGDKVNTFLGHKKWIMTLAFSPDGNYLLSGAQDKLIMLTDLKTGRMVFKSKKQDNYLLAVAFSPKGESFATGELYGQTMRVWNTRALNIKPLDRNVAQKVSQSSGMVPKIAWVSPKNAETVNKASVKIQANIQSASSLRSIELYLNGQLFTSKDRSELMLETAENEITKYIETVVLTEGPNTIQVKAKNIAGEGLSESIMLNYSEAAVKLVSWLNPATDNTETNNPSYPLTFLLNQANTPQTVYVLVNNITQHTLNLPPSGGMINQVVSLSQGLNAVKLIIQANGKTNEAETRTIQLNQANKPLVSWWLPTSDSVSFISSCRISGHVSSQIPLSKVEVKVNGIPAITKANMVETQFIVDMPIMLNPGVNNVQIIASNAAGETVSPTRLITHEIPEQANISWVTPAGSGDVYSALMEVNACIQTKQKINKIQIFNNGIAVLTDVEVQPTPEGECNVSYKRPVMLNLGTNLLKMTAETASGVISTEEIPVNYMIPEKAAITWVSPIDAQSTSSESTMNIQACIKSNTPLTEVTVLANNQVINTVPNPQASTELCSYDLNQVVPLAKGANTILIKAVNVAGEVFSTPLMVDYKTFNPYRFALIIGNEDYSSYQAGLESESDVDFAINDAKAFKTTCQNTLGIAEENIIYLENARFIEMRRALKKISGIIQVTNGKAEVIVYYAGHGFPDEKTKEPYLVPVDGSGSDLEFSAVKLEDFYNWLTEYPAERITVFLDACFSGGARNQGLVAARGIKVVPKETQQAVKKKLIVYSASSGNETSHPYKEKEHGMFTYFLVKKLEEGGPALTYKELSDYLKEQVGLKSVMINNTQQHPQTNISPEVEAEWKSWTFQ